MSNRPDDSSPNNENRIDDAIRISPPAAERRPFRQQPRALYFSVFVWISITGGRFLAPFLEEEGTMTATTIGGLLALQKATSVMASSPCAAFADWVEERHPGLGRRYVLGGGVLLGTLCFCSNACRRLFPTVMIFQSFAWFSLLRILFAVAVSLVFPVLDGVCVDFLKRHGTPKDYGKERLYGAISWAMTNLVIGPALDHYQDFVFLYPAAVVATLLVLLSLKLNGPSRERGAGSNGVSTMIASENGSQLSFKRRTSDLQPNDVHGHLGGNDNKNVTSPSLTPSTAASSRQSKGLLGLCSQFGTNCYSVTFLIALVTLAAGQSIVNDLVFLFFEELGSSFTLMSLTAS
jgi:hypothetical protein